MENLQKKLRDRLADVSYRHYDDRPMISIVVLSYLYDRALKEYCIGSLFTDDSKDREIEQIPFRLQLYVGLNGDRFYFLFQKHEDIDNIKIFKLLN